MQKIHEGDQFGRLTVIRKATREEAAALSAPTDKKLRTFYLCTCSCGKSEPRFYRCDHLRYHLIQSCGCLRSDFATKNGKISGLKVTQSQAGLEQMGFAHGTNVKQLEHTINGRLRSSNTTGVTGVSKKGSKYVAEIHFRKRKYYLGIFDTLKTAKAVRAAAESFLFTMIQQDPEALDHKTLKQEFSQLTQAILHEIA